MSIPLEALFHSGSIVISILIYAMVYITSHLLFGVVVWLLYLCIARRLGGERNIFILRGVAVFIACSWWLVLFHSILFPNSLMAVSDDAPQFAWAFLLLSAGMLVLLGYALFVSINYFLANWWRWAAPLLFMGLSLGTLSTYTVNKEQSRPVGVGGADVIVIGIDSLRPDHLQRFGFAENITPNLNVLLDSAAVFANASTPLARTFPSWVSLLTGLEPIRHGGRFNLMPPELVHGERSIVHAFRDHGYRTIYATDESRFSNIDSKYGFEEVLAPAYGVSDFLLGSLNDAPLTNLLVNTPLGRFLLPFSHANRGAHTTYWPETFDSDLQRIIGTENSRPMFLAVHFCLPHWPYKWSDKDKASFAGYRNQAMAPGYQFYLHSLHRADRQIGALMRYLEVTGRLQNALVVFISDHGESFLLDKDKLHPAGSEGGSLLPQLPGHAVSVADSSQYHVVLAFRGYGPGKVVAATFSEPVSLMDVAPTVMKYALGESNEGLDGHSLDEVIRGKEFPPAARRFIRESGFSVPAILELSPDVAAAFHQGAVFYDLNPVNGRLELKHELLVQLLRNKQRAIVMGQWILAFMPVRQGEIAAYLVDSESMRYWRESEFADSQAPTELLISELCGHYENEAELLPERLCGIQDSLGSSPYIAK